jgi:NADH-quinone oxidoreductase subunit C
MTPEEISSLLKEKFGDAVTAVVLEGPRPYAVVAAERWPEVARFLRDDSRLNLNVLNCISAIDLLAENKLACVYDLSTIAAPDLTRLVAWTHRFAVRVVTDRDRPRIPSVAGVWPAADWHEREAYDLMGIEFEGHPDPRRILCPDDWEGHPLRKDYGFPVEYHGIPATTEYELNSPIH